MSPTIPIKGQNGHFFDKLTDAKKTNEFKVYASMHARAKLNLLLGFSFFQEYYGNGELCFKLLPNDYTNTDSQKMSSQSA